MSVLDDLDEIDRINRILDEIDRILLEEGLELMAEQIPTVVHGSAAMKASGCMDCHGARKERYGMDYRQWRTLIESSADDSVELDPEKHEYFDKRGGLRDCPSVTQILECAGLLSTLKDVPADVLELAKVRGTYVHKASVLIDQGKLNWDSLDPELRPHCEAYRDWQQTTRFRPLMAEKPLINRETRHAGTPDRVGIVDCHLPAIVDLKSGIYSPHTGLQLAGYAALFGTAIPFLRFGLYLGKNSKPRMREFPLSELGRDRQTFLGLVKLYNWKKAEGLI